MDLGKCHTPTLRTGESKFAELSNQTIHPFTDLLVHDMGEGLADGADSNWRTAPLWALKNKRAATDDHKTRFRSGDTKVTSAETQAAAAENPLQLLHDGRARNLAEAPSGTAAKPRPARTATAPSRRPTAKRSRRFS